MDEIYVRKASVTELNTIMEWRMRVLSEVFPDASNAEICALTEANRAYYAECIPSGQHIACFSILDANIIGCGGVCLQRELPSPDNASGLCAYLMNIYTLPYYRGLGAAGKTVNYLIEQSVNTGAQKIYLETTAMGRQLYTDIGFKPLNGFMKYYPH